MPRIYALLAAPGVVALMVAAVMSMFFFNLQHAEDSAASLKRQMHLNEEIATCASQMAAQKYRSQWDRSSVNEQEFEENKKKLIALRNQMRAEGSVAQDKAVDDFLTACNQFKPQDGPTRVVMTVSEVQQQYGVIKGKLIEELDKRNVELNARSTELTKWIYIAGTVFALVTLTCTGLLYRALRQRIARLGQHLQNLKVDEIAPQPTAPHSVLTADEVAAREQYIRELNEAVAAFAIQQPEQS